MNISKGYPLYSTTTKLQKIIYTASLFSNNFFFKRILFGTFKNYNAIFIFFHKPFGKYK